MCGMCNDSTQKKLLVELTLTLDGAVKIAHAMEKEGRDVSELRELTNSSSTVHKVGTQQVKSCVHVKPQKHETAPQCHFQKPCWRCGGEPSVDNCKHANNTRRYSSKQSNLEKACFKK